MNTSIKFIFSFLAGAAVGGGISYLMLKKKHDQKLQEEINELMSMETEPKKEDEDIVIHPISYAEEHELLDEEQRQAYFQKVSESGYTGTSENYYVIDPIDYGEDEEYDPISLTYYADGNIADENDELLDDYESIIGEDFASHFGEFEDDAVYIRNDATKCDYEILRSEKTYHDVLVEKPYLIAGMNEEEE